MTPAHDAHAAEDTGLADSGQPEEVADGQLDDAQSDAATGSPWWRSKRAAIVGGIVLALVAALVATMLLLQRTPEAPDPVAVTVPVALSNVTAPADLKLGVVVTMGQGQSQGSEWAAAAEGAVVAQYRLAAGGSDVELVVEDDRGTPAGSLAAVESLLEEGVSGIVFATSGAHLAPGLEAAAAAKLPAVLPYAPLPEGSDLSDVYTLAPGAKDIEAGLNSAIAEFSYPVLLDAGSGVPGTVKVRETLRPEGGDLPAFAAEAARRTGADATSHGAYTGTPDEEGAETEQPEAEEQPRADALVLSGHPRNLALLVAQLQARNVSVPLILAPDAASPAFAQALEVQGGSVSTSLETVGVNLGDAVALGRDGQARALSAYLQSIRQLADDPDALNLLGDAPFAEVAGWADVRSHDAVLALATAAGEAGSTKPEQVAAQLSSLQLVAGDGVAGTSLDFTTPESASGKVQELVATGQEFGLRPSSGIALSWFTAPSDAP